MTHKEKKKTVVELTLEPDDKKRCAIIDELSGPDARDMLKMVFGTIRGEYAVDCQYDSKPSDCTHTEE